MYSLPMTALVWPINSWAVSFVLLTTVCVLSTCSIPWFNRMPLQPSEQFCTTALWCWIQHYSPFSALHCITSHTMLIWTACGMYRHWVGVLDIRSPMDLQQSPSCIASSLLNLLHPQVHSISITSPTPPFVPVPLVSSFVPVSLFPWYLSPCHHDPLVLPWNLLTPFLFLVSC